MKNILLQLILLSFLTTNLYATHNRSGFITCKHISGYTYEIILTTFTMESSVSADRCELTIFFGDGDSATFTRSNNNKDIPQNCPNGVGNGESLGNNVKKNIYKGSHTFPGVGIFTISFTESNRIYGISNIPNSEVVPFHIYTKLYVLNPSLNCISNSVDLATLPIYVVSTGLPYKSDFPISFSDNDSISYELTNCEFDTDSAIVGYTLPKGILVDTTSGRISWLNPTLGIYSLAVKIRKWRNRVLAGETFCDIQMQVYSTKLPPISLNSLTKTCTLDKNNNSVCDTNLTKDLNIYTIAPNNRLEISIVDDGGCEISVYSEIDSLTNASSFSSNIFKWTPETSNARKTPYKIIFRLLKTASDINNQYNYYKDYTWLIYVSGDTSNVCTPPVLDQCYAHYSTDYDTLQNSFSLKVDYFTSKNAIAYKWNFGDGTFSTSRAPSHIYLKDTAYWVSMKIYTSANDSCLYNRYIGKNYKGNIYRRSGFTIDVVNPVLLSGITDYSTNESNNYTIMPNPTNGIVNIVFKQIVNNASARIINITGQTIIQQNNFTGNKLSFDLSDYASGLYIIEVNENGVVTRNKLLKE